MMDTAAYQRKIDELQQQLEASQRVNARVNQDLDRKYRQALEDNAQLRQSLNGMPMHQQPHHHHMPHHMSHHHHGQHQHHAPSHQMHYMSHHGNGYGGGVPGQMPVQPQQPVNVTVGPRGHSVGLQPPPPPPPPPMPASVDNRAADEIAHLKAELALKQQIIDQYRIKTKAMNLGLENIQSPSSSLERLPTTPLGPAQGPAAKTAPARPGRQSGGGRTLLDVLAQQDASPVESAAATTTCSPRGADIGIQNSVATHDAFCQTEPQASFGSATSASSSSTAKGNKGAAAPPPTPSDPSVPLTTSFVDAASGGVAEAFFTSTAVLDTVGRLPTSKPLRVNLFVAQAGVSSVSNGSFNCLPAALVAEVLTPSLPNGSAAPNSKFGSWADEPTELFGGSTNSLPAARVSVPNQGSPSNGPKRQAPPNSSAPSNHTSAMNGSGSLSRGGSFENGRNSLSHGKKTSSNGKITATSSSM